ncbi:peptide/nickel transport system permease protein [Anaerotaenia torta]|uniref:ABC transporter permease n=1 Tax=Anaerotaenia torta TaxID=433293 RepID=UPI003D1C00CA
MVFGKKKVNKSESYYLASQWTLMARKLRKHKLAKISMWILGLLYIGVIFAGFIAPYGLEDYDKTYQNTAPSKIHLFHEGEFVGPFVYSVKKYNNPETFRVEITEDTSEYYKLKLFVRGGEYKILGLIQSNIHLFGTSTGSAGGTGGKVMLFGSDQLGRDIFSRILYGSQISLTIPFASAAISFVLGITIGSISGYFGGVIDNVIQRIIEVIGAIPSIPLWMAMSAAIPAGISTIQMYLFITVILSLINWCGIARVVRGKFMSLKNEDYVMAARIAGVRDGVIILKHLVPGFLSYLIVSITLSIPSSIIGETSMSFLGLGIRTPATSWGVLLDETKNIANFSQYPWKMIPLFFVIVAVLAFNFLGDGLRDAADPYK